MTTERELPEGWRILPFAEIAENINERVDDPSSSGLDHYVGLEHLDPDTLKISRWGSPTDVEATKLRFYRGDVIYARRRAYQRKLGVAEWDGIASAHALVLRARPEVCIPEFLPYFLQSDQFHHRALDISVGSLSPTINWKTLAVQEFSLPPESEQRRHVEILSAAATLGSAYSDSERALTTLWEAILAGLPAMYEMRGVPLDEVCRQPITYGIVQAGPEVPGGTPYVRVSDMTDSEVLEPNRLPRTAVEIADKYKRSACEPGDLIFALRGPIGLTRVVPDSLDGVNLTQGTARLSPDTSKVSTDYLGWALRSPRVRSQYRAVQKGSTFQELSLGALRKIEIDVPRDPEHQSRIVTELETAAEAQRAARESATRSGLLGARLRERLLAGDNP